MHATDVKIKICSWLAAAILGWAAPPVVHAAEWFDPAWAFRRQLTFNNLAQAESLSAFPVLVVLDATRIDTAQVKNGGEDLRFVDADGALLAHEIESWNEAGSSYVWVRVPQVDGASDSDFIWMYYGNAAAADSQNADSLWSNGYVGVWHLNQDPSGGVGSVTDSSPFANHGDPFNMDGTNLQAGRVGDGLYFDGSPPPNADHVRISSDGVDELSISGTQLTLEAWVYRTGSTGQWLVAVGRQVEAGSVDSYVLAAKYDVPDVVAVVAGGSLNSPSGVLPENEWRYLAGVRDGDSLLVYANGSEADRVTGLATTIQTDANDVIIGAQENDASSDPDTPWLGVVDEVRISNVPRSADWIAAQYLSMVDSFIAYGVEESSMAVAGVVVVDTVVDTLDGNVTSIAALYGDKGVDGAISLREAILATNNTPNGGEADSVRFDIPGSPAGDAHTIQLESPLPAISDTLVVDGTSEPDFLTAPVIEIDGQNAGPAATGLFLDSGSDGTTVRGLVINGFSNYGIYAASHGIVIAGNHIGTNAAGTAPLANGMAGIYIAGSSSIIGGLVASDRNVISGNTTGIMIAGPLATDNMVRGNFIGTDANGTGALGNSQNGIHIHSLASNNVIGGPGAQARNIISANGGHGIFVDGCDGSTIQSNYVGADVTGAPVMGNGSHGILIKGGNANTIGGSGVGDGNLVVGNGAAGVATTDP